MGWKITFIKEQTVIKMKNDKNILAIMANSMFLLIYYHLHKSFVPTCHCQIQKDWTKIKIILRNVKDEHNKYIYSPEWEENHPILQTPHRHDGVCDGVHFNPTPHSPQSLPPQDCPQASPSFLLLPSATKDSILLLKS